MPDVPARLRQQHRDVELRLDGNAYAWAWTPNVTEPAERLRIDLLPDLAVYCHLGRGRAPEPATWDDDGSLTLVVSVHLGATGTAGIAGDPVSDAAVAELAAAGFLAAVRMGMGADLGSDSTGVAREDPT